MGTTVDRIMARLLGRTVIANGDMRPSCTASGNLKLEFSRGGEMLVSVGTMVHSAKKRFSIFNHGCSGGLYVNIYRVERRVRCTC